MTFDPIIILTTITIILSLSGLYLFVRLRDAERELITLKADTFTIVCRLTDMVEQTTVDLGRLAKVVTVMQSDRHREYSAQACTSDAHDDRLLSLEETEQ